MQRQRRRQQREAAATAAAGVAQTQQDWRRQQQPLQRQLQGNKGKQQRQGSERRLHLRTGR